MPKPPAAESIFFDSDTAVFHLAAIAFESDRPRGRHFHRGLEHFTVAETEGGTVFDRDFDFIPFARAIVLQLLVRAGEKIVATLQLRTPNEDAAVSVGRRAKFEPKDKVFWKFACRIDLLNPATFSRSRN